MLIKRHARADTGMHEDRTTPLELDGKVLQKIAVRLRHACNRLGVDRGKRAVGCILDPVRCKRCSAAA